MTSPGMGPDLMTLRPAFFELWHRPRGWRLGVTLALLAAFLASTAALVHATGGTRFSPVHFVYVAILGAAFAFGAVGGVATGVLAGLVVGPLMPLDTAVGSRQETLNWMVRTGFFVMVGAIAGLMSTALMRQLSAARRTSLYGPLTSLPNRNALRLVLAELLRQREPSPGHVILVKLGVANMDAITAAFGHQSAESAADAIAHRIAAATGEEATLFELTGNRFAMLFVDSSLTDAVRTSRRILAVMAEPVTIPEMPLLADCRIGIARLPRDASDGNALIRAAGATLEDAISDGRPYALFDPERDEARRRGTALLPDLRTALRDGLGLALHYQPKIRLADGRCTGVEALIRWEHPSRGKISPAEFIPLAENTALVRLLSEWVLAAATHQALAWRNRNLLLSTSINLSVRNLEDEAFVDHLIAHVDDSGLDPSKLEIEVTETALMDRLALVRGALERFRDRGLRVALDDFGTGQSSLAYLRDLPIDVIKLDRTFTFGLMDDRRQRIIVAKTIEIARELGFEVVTEGIEDEETAGLVGAFGCGTGQGYFFAPPRPASDFSEWLRARDAVIA